VRHVADDLTIKIPEAGCWRDDTLGLSNGGSCGPMQRCIDVGNPNYGLTSFDNMFGAMGSLFQSFSGDGQYQILWAALQSEPSWAPMTYCFFIALGFGLGHVLINVFIAVFANVFSQSRVSFRIRNQERAAAFERQKREEAGSSTSRSSSSHSSYGSSSGSLSSRSGSSLNSGSSKSSSRSNGIFVSLEEQVRRIKTKEVDPLLQTYMVWLFRNQVYGTITFLVIATQALALAMNGTVCWYVADGPPCPADDVLIDIINNANVYFMVDFFLQVLCDGSLARHFEHGEHIFNFFVTITTSTAVIGTVLGLPNSATSFIRGFAIFRLLRGCKFYLLEPIWLMLVKATTSIVPIMNLTLFNAVFSIAWYLLGRILFDDSLTQVNPRTNFSSMSRGYMLLFQLITGDSWANLMYEAMNVFCPLGECSSEDKLFVAMAAMYYIAYFFYGHFIFITMFLAVVLEAFSVQDFMTAYSGETVDHQLTKDMLVDEVASFHMLPRELVSDPNRPLILYVASLKLSTASSAWTSSPSSSSNSSCCSSSSSSSSPPPPPPPPTHSAIQL